MAGAQGLAMTTAGVGPLAGQYLYLLNGPNLHFFKKSAPYLINEIHGQNGPRKESKIRNPKVEIRNDAGTDKHLHFRAPHTSHPPTQVQVPARGAEGLLSA